MTVSQPVGAALQAPTLLPLPDPSRRNPDELTANFKHLTINGGVLHLASISAIPPPLCWEATATWPSSRSAT